MNDNNHNIMRFSLWQDITTQKFIMVISQYNKRIKNLKQYPFAYKMGRSFCGKLTDNVLENLRKDYMVIFA